MKKKDPKIKDIKKEGKKETYPGVRFDKDLNKYIATSKKDGVLFVSTRETFEEAKTAMIKFELM